MAVAPYSESHIRPRPWPWNAVAVRRGGRSQVNQPLYHRARAMKYTANARESENDVQTPRRRVTSQETPSSRRPTPTGNLYASCVSPRSAAPFYQTAADVRGRTRTPAGNARGNDDDVWVGIQHDQRTSARRQTSTASRRLCLCLLRLPSVHLVALRFGALDDPLEREPLACGEGPAVADDDRIREAEAWCECEPV